LKVAGIPGPPPVKQTSCQHKNVLKIGTRIAKDKVQRKKRQKIDSRTDMKISSQTIQQLNLINHCLLNGDGGSVEKILTNGPIETLLSQEAISYARIENKKPLTLLLCTLATNNDIEPDRAQNWLDIYQSLVNKQLTQYVNDLPKGNVLKEIIESIIATSELTVSQIRLYKGSKKEWLDSVEICMDFNQWKIAEIMVCNTAKFQDKNQWFQDLIPILASRHKHYVNEIGNKKTDVDYRILVKLYDFCAIYASKNQQSKLAASMQQLQAGALEVNHKYEEAITLLKKIQYKSNSLNTNFSIARCYCKLDKHIECLDYLDKSIDGLIKEKVTSNTKENDTEKEKIKDNKFEIKASKALKDLAIISAKKNVPFFLVSGTLLGYAREGKLLSHDKDIDIGILGWENQYELSLAIKQSGVFSLEIEFLKGQKTYFIPIKHLATGIWIDIFVYHEENDHLVTGVDFFFGHQQTFKFSKFDLKEIDFLDVKMFAPSNIEKNLDENFGNWKIPDKGYISHLESPSTMNSQSTDYQITTRMQVLAAIKSKDILKL
jgi:tetratricopeptide (TPR) repeat protein